MRRTKIICTLGPSSNSKEMIRKLAEQGMDVARLNFSHGTHEEHKKVITAIKEVRRELGKPLGILLDTKGPEIRTGDMEKVSLKAGDIIYLVKDKKFEKDVPISPGFIASQIQVKDRVLFDDGYIEGLVIAKEGERLTVEIRNDGVLQKQKRVNVPGQVFDLPDITKEDIEDIAFGCREGIEMIAASFINHAKQVLTIRELLEREGREDILIISKIESKRGVQNFEEILEVSDGIMVARGDLGVEVFVPQVPPLQKKMIRESNRKAKPVIIATQMLESMIKNPRPTRAEASDVANAIYDAASAVMLSGETAVGAYPLQTVAMMDQIIREAEKDFDYSKFFKGESELLTQEIPSAVARAAVHTAYDIGAKAIFVATGHGHAVKRICRFHPNIPIIAITPRETTFQQTSLFWGTTAILEADTAIELESKVCAKRALKKGWVEYGDLVIMATGKPYGVSFTTNMIIVQSVGEVILRGKKMKAPLSPVTGEIAFLLTPDQTLEGKIVVVKSLTHSLLEKLTKAKGILLQNPPLDTASEELLMKFTEKRPIPYITRIEGALSLLKEGDLVRLDPTLGVVFQGKSPTKEEMLS
ncbi:MAG: pyruvate kinase [Verrucomicrobia bacterium]|nr:pyruvate kinase [Verrucomicrobiota bacterium]